MVQINLQTIDSAIINQTNFGNDMKRWQTNLIDLLNANFSLIQQWMNNLITSSGIDIGGSGAGPINVTVTGLTSSGFVSARIVSTTNPGITIASITPGTDLFSITFSADPGASAIIVYQAFTSQPQ